MRGPIILSCALTGGADTTKKSPYVPVTPKAIAEHALNAEAAGAAVAHIHVRDPQSGRPAVNIEYYEEVVDRIRSAGSNLIINLTTGTGGLFQAREDGTCGFEPCLAVNPPMTARERVAHVLKIRPDICSLDIATMNFGPIPMINTPAQIAEMAGLIAQANVKPEIEVFDLGHLRLAIDLLERGVLRSPAFFQFCLGIPWGAPALPEAVALMRSMLPRDSVWSAFAISTEEFPMVATAAAMGGHVRVGLEDNLYIERGKLAKDNAELVTKARQIIADLGYSLATPAEARKILSL